MPNFAGLPIERLDEGKISWDHVRHLIDGVLENCYWFLDEGVLHIVSKQDDVYGPDTEMCQAIQALLDCGEHDFYYGDLGEYLRLDAVPECYRYFHKEHGFYVVLA